MATIRNQWIDPRELLESPAVVSPLDVTPLVVTPIVTDEPEGHLIENDLSLAAATGDPTLRPLSDYLAYSTLAGNIGTSRTRFWSNIDNGAAITTPRALSQKERIMVGAAAEYSALSFTGTPTFGWLTSATGPSWLPRDSQIAAVHSDGAIAISGSSRASDGPSTAGAIALGGFVLNNTLSGKSAWAGYFEAETNSGGKVIAIEIDTKNVDGVSYTPTPFAFGGPAGVAYGLQLNSGGDPVYGGVANTPSSAAIVVTWNAAQPWNAGIIFQNGSLGSSKVALGLAPDHLIVWYLSDGTAAAALTSTVATSGHGVRINFADDAIQLRNSTGIGFEVVPSAGTANYLRALNAAAANAPQFAAVGSDADIDIRLTPKGTGVLRFGTNTAKAAEAFASYITIKDSGGTLRKLMVCA